MGYVYEVGCGIIIVVNKWDIVKKDINIMCDFEVEICDEF